MRHFLRTASAIAGLPSGVTLPTAQRQLVPLTRFTHAPATAYRSAFAAAKLLATITALAELHLPPAKAALK
jgi:hypothetical protein